MKVKNFAIYTLVFGILVVAYILYSIGVKQIFSLLARASIVFILGYIITSVLIAVILTFKWKLILHSKGIDVPYFRLFTYRLVGYSVSYLTPTAHVGGEPIRAYLLQREGVPLTTAFSTIIIDRSTELIANVTFFFFGALLLLHSVVVAFNTKIIIVVVSLALLLLMLMFVAGILRKGSMFVAIFRFLRMNRIKKLRPIEKNLAKIEKEIEHFYRKKKEYFFAIVLMVGLLWILMFFEYRFALLMLGHIASPFQVFLILTGVGLAYSIPVPAAVGTLEVGQLSAAKVLDLSSATAIALAFIIRMRDIVWTVLGMIFLGGYNFNFTKLARESKKLDREFEKGDLFKGKRT